MAWVCTIFGVITSIPGVRQAFEQVVNFVYEQARNCVSEQVDYVWNYTSNVENLRIKLQNLSGAKTRLENSVPQEDRRDRRIEADVENWMKRVGETIEKANKLLNDCEAQERCFYGYCANLAARYHPGREATKLAKIIDAEIQKWKEFPIVSQDTWSTAGYGAFESRISFVNNIIKELTDPHNHIIGIYGLPGVGKSTLVKQVAKQAEENKLFLDVARVEVRQDTDVKRIQKEIAEKFGLVLDENLTNAGRARLLSDYIKNKKNILVILDDVWEMIDLEKLGLPRGTCKILLTSRTRDILSSNIGTQKEYLLEVLDQQETWSLFENMVADDVKKPDILETATEVAKRCGGLPILVETLAKTLKGKSIHSWKDALRLQKRCEGKEMEEKAYLGIEWSYNQLEGEEVKSLFLICGMLAKRYHSFEDLLKYTKGLGLSLFEGINTMEEARSRLHSLVDKLKDFCLLLDITANEIIVMHDLTRDVARKIASRDKHFLSLTYADEFKEWPNEECMLISFFEINKIPSLPEKLECPKLQLFHFKDAHKSLTIPPNFFKEMKELKVLDLTYICIPSLPPSLRFLTNLQTLCLDQCELRNIAMVGELTSLEILSFVHSKFKLLPKEVGQLTRLRVLDLSGCSQLEVIHPNVISSLTRLEELRMNNNFIKWEIEQVSDNISETNNASLSELKHLSTLTTLDINIKDASQLPIECFSEKLVNFRISIGDVWISSAKYSTSRMLKLKLSQTNQLDQGLKMLMKKSEKLYLDVLEGVNDVVGQLDVDGFPRLKNLHVQNDPEILQIVNCWSSSPIAFPNLEKLFLCNLVSLESLCSGQLPHGCFRQLTFIKVEKCPKLKNLFSFSTVLHFLQLQAIEVVDCNNMQEIVVDEKEENFEAPVNDRIEFFQLRSLTLQSLPKFTCFASNNNEIVSHMGLFNHKEQVAFPKLVENLTSLIVDGCAGLTFLHSSSMAKNFVQLKKLRICRCQNIVEIISTEEHNGIEEKMDNMFPKLESLELDTLANLETFCSSATYLKFSCLNSLDIKDCTKLGPFIHDRMGNNIRDAAEHYLFDEKVGFPSLEKLVIRGLHKLRTIWHTQLDPNSFCKLTQISVEACQNLLHILVPGTLQSLIDSALKILRIENCESLQAVFKIDKCRSLCEVIIHTCRSLKNVFPASVARNSNLGKLQTLRIKNCELLEEIVGEEVGVEVEAIMPKFVFPSAENVVLVDLPQLSSFYPGMHTSKWPSLIELRVIRCDKLEMLAAESLCFQQQHHHQLLGIPTYKQVFFLYEKGSFSYLKTLELGIKETSYGSLPVDFFKIKSLFFGCQYITSAVPPSVLFQKCHNLETLEVYYGNIEEIFIHGGSLDGEQHLGWTLTHLKTLRFDGMWNLMHVWKDNSHLAGPVFPNLEFLSVKDCPRLKNIVSSAISFRNIVELEVVDCDGMEHLITYSAAKSFINLEKLTVKDCQRMIEIVASDDDGDIIDEENNEITFDRLEYLQLSALPNLKGFCSRHYNVTFPFYITLSVSSCLEIKISPDGVLLDDSKRERSVPIAIIEEEDDDDDDDDDEKQHHADNDDPNDDNADKGNAVDEAL